MKKNVMKSKVFVIGLLAFTLFAFIVPESAFAQKKQKLGDDAAKALFEKLEKNDNPDIKEAIKIISYYATAGKKGDTSSMGFAWPGGMAENLKSKKIKQIFSVIDAGADIYDKIGNVAEVYNLYSSWRFAKNDTKSVKKAANCMFDVLDFAAGKFAGGAYYGAAIRLAREAFTAMQEYYGNIRWTDIYSNPTSVMSQGALNNPRSGSWYTNSNYYEFARAWFCAAYDSGSSEKSRTFDLGILMDISKYIWAVETLKKAGLM
jgi:hypothetical protein